jgi:hypothetical protein
MSVVKAISTTAHKTVKAIDAISKGEGSKNKDEITIMSNIIKRMPYFIGDLYTFLENTAPTAKYTGGTVATTGNFTLKWAGAEEEKTKKKKSKTQKRKEAERKHPIKASSSGMVAVGARATKQ